MSGELSENARMAKALEDQVAWCDISDHHYVQDVEALRAGAAALREVEQLRAEVTQLRARLDQEMEES